MFRKIDHIGLAVKSIAVSARLYGERLGLPLGAIETIESEGVRVAFYGDGETRIELLEPLDASGPVARFLDKRGEGVHHVCLEVGDIDNAVAGLKQAGIEPVGAAPRTGAGGCRVAFLHPRDTGGLLIELSQKPKVTAGRLRLGQVVLVYLQEPKERFWGVLADMTPLGVTIEGIDLNSYDDWTSSAAAEGGADASIVFFPTQRIEKILLDLSASGVPSLEERFEARVGHGLAAYLRARRRT